MTVSKDGALAVRAGVGTGPYVGCEGRWAGVGTGPYMGCEGRWAGGRVPPLSRLWRQLPSRGAFPLPALRATFPRGEGLSAGRWGGEGRCGHRPLREAERFFNHPRRGYINCAFCILNFAFAINPLRGLRLILFRLTLPVRRVLPGFGPGLLLPRDGLRCRSGLPGRWGCRWGSGG